MGEPRRQICQGPRTVAIMRNIPSEYTREELLDLIDQQGFQGLYDFFYLPYDFQTNLNQGYAFINFATMESFERFQEHFSGFKNWEVLSDSICEVSFSDKLCNSGDCIETYRNSAVMRDHVEDRFKPVVFEHGQRIPFPEPTKKLGRLKTR